MFPLHYFDSSTPPLGVGAGYEGADVPVLALLTGPRGVGKTSLAFQYAVSAACRGEIVLYCVHQATLQAAMPRPQTPLYHLPDEVLGLIEFVYVDTYDGVCQALATVGTRASCCDGMPTHVIVEETGLQPAGDARVMGGTMACLGGTVAALRAAGVEASTGVYVCESHEGIASLGTYPFAVSSHWWHIGMTYGAGGGCDEMATHGGSAPTRVRLAPVVHGAVSGRHGVYEMGLAFSGDVMVVVEGLHRLLGDADTFAN